MAEPYESLVFRQVLFALTQVGVSPLLAIFHAETCIDDLRCGQADASICTILQSTMQSSVPHRSNGAGQIHPLADSLP